MEMGELLQATLDNPRLDTNGADKIKAIRDYLKKQSKNNVLIIYSNSPDADACGAKESQYVLDTVGKEVSQNQQIETLYVGAGHGWPRAKHGMLSALNVATVDKLLGILKDKGVSAEKIVLGSCYSASFATDFSALLGESSVMISSTLPQGGTNLFNETARHMMGRPGKSSPFFLGDCNSDNVPSGLCITTPNRHLGLKLSEKTGLPANAVGSEDYQLSSEIVREMMKAKPESIFFDSLNGSNQGKLKAKFNVEVQHIKMDQLIRSARDLIQTEIDNNGIFFKTYTDEQIQILTSMDKALSVYQEQRISGIDAEKVLSNDKALFALLTRAITQLAATGIKQDKILPISKEIQAVLACVDVDFSAKIESDTTKTVTVKFRQEIQSERPSAPETDIMRPKI